MTCIAGLTAQNTQGVKDVYPVKDKDFIRKCLDAVDSDIGVDAVKTGMLSTAETVKVVAEKLQEMKDAAKKNGKSFDIVVDPVMISTSGYALIPEEAIDDYLEKLIPLATIFTPNVVEAKFALKKIQENSAKKLGNSFDDQEVEIDSVEQMKETAKRLHDFLGCGAVLVKGGHLAFTKDLKPYKNTNSDTRGGLVIVDILYDGTDYTEFKSDFFVSKSTHGTGCTLSAAIASNLAKGNSMVNSVKAATYYVQHAIKTAYPLGKGFGPVNHMHNIQHMPFIGGKFLDYLLEHPKVKPLWDQYVNHPFTKQLAYNKLSLSSFKYFLEQDYLYLKHYARCYGLSVYKANDMDTVIKAATVIQKIAHEMNLHIEYCKSFGLSIEQLEKGQEGLATYAYSRYLLDVGSTNDWFSLQVALSPCLFGYLAAVEALVKDPKSVKTGNKYWKWVENYSADDFREAAVRGRELLEFHASKQSEEQIEKLVGIFATATKMEINFWNAALDYSPYESSTLVDTR